MNTGLRHDEAWSHRGYFLSLNRYLLSAGKPA